MNAEVVIYGASGYTGKHVAERLAQKGIPFIAAGRNRDRIAQQLAALPGLAGARYEVVGVEHEEAALTALLRGKKVVYNLVGPYMQLGRPVLHAALAAGCHYLDCTGEQDWMYLLKSDYAERFAAKDLALLPATSAMWNMGMLASELVLQTPGIDALDITYTLSGVPSVSSTLSFMRMCCQPQYLLQNNRRVAWPVGSVEIVTPGVHEVLVALPWSGGGEAVWFEDDPRVHTCSTLVTFRNRALMDMIVRRATEFQAHYADKPPAEQEAATNRWAMEIAPQGDLARDDRALHRALISCQGRGENDVRSLVLPGVALGYVGTSVLGSLTIDTLLRNQQRRVGFTAALYATGVQAMLAELQEQHVLGQPRNVVI